MNLNFSHEEINKGRQYEFDLVKAVTIILMIWTHVYEQLTTGFEPSISAVNAYWRGCIFGASTFMFCMGMGMVYTRSSSPSDYFKRGIHILFIGIILNLFRELIPGVLTGRFFIEPQRTCCLVLVFGVDIFQFAGLAFLLMALLRKIGLRYRHILVISVLMSGAAWFLEGIQTGNFFVDQALGYLWGNDSECYFPLFNWFIFVAAGCWFGKLYLHLQDKARFHRICFPVGLAVTATYLLICIKCDQNLFVQFKDEIFLAFRRLPDAVMTILANVWLISLFYYIAKAIPQKAIPTLTHPSKHISQYFCISWVVIYFIYNIFGSEIDSDPATMALWLGVLAMTAGIVIVYDKYLQDKMTAFFGRNRTFWIVLVLVVFVAAGLYGYFVCDGQYPTFLNDYSIG